MRIILVRHGESAGNVDRSFHKTMPDHAIPLSDRGRKQAVEAGEKIHRFLKDHKKAVSGGGVRLWTSPYARTRQTADGIMESSASEWIRDRRENILLCEQQFGLFDGLEDNELREQFPNEHSFYSKCEKFEGRFWARMPLGESRFDVATRVHQSFGTFHRDNERHEINTIIVVCHGVTLRAFVMMWCHLSPEWFDAEPNPNNCDIRIIEDGIDKRYL